MNSRGHYYILAHAYRRREVRFIERTDAIGDSSIVTDVRDPSADTG